MNPSRNILATFGINGSLRRMETHSPEHNLEHYLFNSAANLKAYSSEAMDFAYYGYNASNARAYKMSLSGTYQWHNGQQLQMNLQPQLTQFYPNAYINFNGNGEYTKHYYNGTERIASRLGNVPQSYAVVPNSRLAARITQVNQRFQSDIQELMCMEIPVETPQVPVENLQATGNATDIFYYHTNHLGSTAFVTDNNATITQGFLYAPFGEITTEYNATFGNDVIPKYSFNAKELDEETGMYYYEARYYKPPVFTSRDAMFEKYFWMSPYAYCANNPVKYVDPSGMHFDPTQDQKYIQPMENDIQNILSERITLRDQHEVGSDEYNRLNEHVTELTNALSEIKLLRKDENNLYILNFHDIMFNPEAGITIYADAVGSITYGGLKGNMKVINLNFKEFYTKTTETMLHEFKHAFQFYSDLIGFYVPDFLSSDIYSQEATISYGQEKRAKYRAAVFLSDTTSTIFNYIMSGYSNCPSGTTTKSVGEQEAKAKGMIYVTGSTKICR